jgi:hypothetical protein
MYEQWGSILDGKTVLGARVVNRNRRKTEHVLRPEHGARVLELMRADIIGGRVEDYAHAFAARGGMMSIEAEWDDRRSEKLVSTKSRSCDLGSWGNLFRSM